MDDICWMDVLKPTKYLVQEVLQAYIEDIVMNEAIYNTHDKTSINIVKSKKEDMDA